VNSLLWNRLITVLSWAGVFVAGVLSAKHFLHLQLPCGLSEDCEKVANHPSSVWFGVPVAALGLGAYLALCLINALIALRGPLQSRALIRWGVTIATVGAIVSVVLQGYSIGVIKATCPWCLASAVIMVLIFVGYMGLLQSLPDEPQSDPPTANGSKGFGPDLLLTGFCVVLAFGLIGWRVSTMQKEAAAPAIAVTGGLQSVPVEKIVKNPEHFRGPADAPVTVIEFADFYCPTCREGYPKLKRMFEESNGRMRIAYRHYPLYMKAGHEQALTAAVVAEIAASKGKFWPFVDAMFAAPLTQIQSRDGVLAVAGQLGLDQTEIIRILGQEESPFLDVVYEDYELANSLGIQGTPTYLIYAQGTKPFAASPSMLEPTLKGAPYSDLLRPAGPGVSGGQ